MWVNARAVVRNGEVNPLSVERYIESKLRHTRCMLCGVIQKVHDDLSDEHCVNIDEHRLIGNGNLEVYLRVTLFEISKALAENFLDKLGLFRCESAPFRLFELSTAGFQPFAQAIRHPAWRR